MNGVGRNDPCPCGSGRKFKQCHLRQAEAVRDIHDRDRAWRWQLYEWGEENLDVGLSDLRLEDDDPLLHFLLPLHLFHIDYGGTTIAQRFLDEHGAPIPDSDRRWLEAQLASWVSIWEVEKVEMGSSLNLRDILTGEKRMVLDVTASMSCSVSTNLLARTLDFDGVSYLCGTHPAPLPPFLGDMAAQLACDKLRVKRRPSPRRLRGSKGALIVFDAWEEVLEVLDKSLSKHEFTNTDGDALLGVTDRFMFEAGSRKEVMDRITSIPGAEQVDETTIVLTRDDVLVASVAIEAARLKVESNSIRRGDFVRDTLQNACGDQIRFHSRALADPLSERYQDEVMQRGPLERSAGEMELALEFKRRHYARWIDDPIPMLDGQTPRRAIQSEEGRSRLDLLLRDMQYRESSLPQQEQFDMNILRRELGLD